MLFFDSIVFEAMGMGTAFIVGAISYFDLSLPSLYIYGVDHCVFINGT